MVSKVSKGINVSVEVYYQPNNSNPVLREYLFAYRITLENKNNFTVQLLRRHWYIFDSDASYKQVEGEGVVGLQPIINPGEKYQYISGCNLKTDMGKMHGKYVMLNCYNKQLFEIVIPPFQLIYPFKNN
jgi:ApaG protein